MEAYCLTPKIYVNRSCVSFAKTIGGVRYRVFLMLIPLSSNRNVSGMAMCMQKHTLHILSGIGLADVLYKFSVHVMRRLQNTLENNTNAEEYYVVYLELYLPMNMEIGMTQVSSVDKLLRLHGEIITLQCQQNTTEDFFVRLDNFDMLEKNLNVSETLFHRDSVCQCKIQLERVTQLRYALPYSNGFGDYDASTVVDLKYTYICPLIKLNASFYDLNHTAWGVVLQAYSVTLNMSEYSTDCAGNLGDVCVCKATLDYIAAHVSNTSPADAIDMLTIFVVHIILHILVYTHLF